MATRVVAHARVVKIHMPKTANKTFSLFEQMRPEMSGIFTPLTPFPNPDFYGTPTISAFCFNRKDNAQLCFIVSEVETNKKEIEFGRLVLPMSWFPMNRVVTYPFPLAMKKKGTPAIMMLVDVHLSDDGSEPFDAPSGKLRVSPTWDVPECMTAKSNVHNVGPATPPPAKSSPASTAKAPPAVVVPDTSKRGQKKPAARPLAVQKNPVVVQVPPIKTEFKATQTDKSLEPKPRQVQSCRLPDRDHDGPIPADGASTTRVDELDDSEPKRRRILCTF